LLDQEVEALRQQDSRDPEDPHLLISTEATSSTRVDEAGVTDVSDVLASVQQESMRQPPVDLVGIYAGGDVHRGFGSSYGHRHWLTSRSSQIDWCLVQDADKAVKCSWAGPQWDAEAFASRMSTARKQLDVLSRPAHRVSPGAYRAFLTPAALGEIIDLVSWGDFGARSHRSGASVLSRLAAGTAELDPRVSISEHTAGGLAPAFQEDGFVRPSEVKLVEAGKHAGMLVSPRSAREFDLQPNGASSSEMPQSLAMAGGALEEDDILHTLGTGVWVSNLWYLNHSDRNAARITGMTRFATFWVEGGQIVAPLSVMRFDDSLYALLGSKVEALTRRVDLLPSTSTYGERSISSVRVPGALLRDLTFTL
jgi:predicted Zn-dependent protease